MWESTRNFAQNNNVRFTYFISGVYFLKSKLRTLYTPPASLKPGASAIGFGSTSEDITERIHEVLNAAQEGNEISSHANGHFDGHTWSAEDWRKEFDMFDFLLLNVFTNNGIQEFFTDAWTSIVKQVQGFRAPQLGISDGLYQTLQERSYSYDASQASKKNYWPQQNGRGTWNLPLASLKIFGTCKKTLSMDYNFYWAQSNAKEDIENSKIYEEQMYSTYMNYFINNYFGNRAPVNIGHHFSTWNNGAYWKAMKRFVESVCTLPEVKCSTYSELVQFLEGNKNKLSYYQKGHFSPLLRQEVAVNAQEDSCDIQTQFPKEKSKKNVSVLIKGRTLNQVLEKGGYYTVATDGNEVSFYQKTSRGQKELTVPLQGPVAPKTISISLKDSRGLEVYRTDHKLSYSNTGVTVEEENIFDQKSLIPDPAEAHMDESGFSN